MKKVAKLALATAILSASLLSSPQQAKACSHVCNFLCIIGSHCAIVHGCATCVPD